MDIFASEGDRIAQDKLGIDVEERYDPSKYEGPIVKDNKGRRVHGGRHLRPSIRRKLGAAARNATLATALSASVVSGVKMDKGSSTSPGYEPADTRGIKITPDSSHRIVYESPQGAVQAPINPSTPPTESAPKSEKIEKKIDIMEVRAQLVNKLLPGLTGDEFMKINEQIDREMKGRELGNIEKLWKEYGSFINMEGKEFQIPDWAIFGMLATESRFDPTAVSEADAVGIAQITKIAGIDMGIVDDARGMDLRDVPSASIAGLARYVSKYRTYFAGDLAYGIQAYKTGPGHLRGYAVNVTGKDEVKDAARARNVYSVITEVTPHDPADKVYLTRVIGHGAEFLAYYLAAA